MNSNIYTDILNSALLPFIARNNYKKFNIHQDNDPKHKANICKNTLTNLSLNWVKLFFFLIKIKNSPSCLFKIKSPASSPDLNPIEMLWADLKRYVRSKQCKNEREIIAAVFEFHRALTPEKCSKYIKKLIKVIDCVIEKKGDWSNF